jgi:DNA-binding NarL/FixJ family response regulator
MTRVVIVADSGASFAMLTAAVNAVERAYIVRYGSGRSPLDRLVGTVDPDLVLIADLRMPSQALARLAEVRRAARQAKVVVISAGPEADWLPDALRAEAAAVVPGSLAPQTLAIVLREVLDEPARAIDGAGERQGSLRGGPRRSRTSARATAPDTGTRVPLRTTSEQLRCAS